MSDYDSDYDYSDSTVSASPNGYPFLRDLDLDQEVSRRITLHLDSLTIGNNEVYTTPLCKKMSPEVILEKWDEIFNSNRSKMNDVLLDLEMSNRSKFGPRSIAKPWKDRIEDIKGYYQTRDDSNHLSINYKQNSKRFRPLSPDKAVKLLKNSTNSGLPYYCKKGKIKPRLLRDLEGLKYRKDPCILFTRTQESGKTRNVWGYPVYDTLTEMCYYTVLLSYQRSQTWRAAINSPDVVDREVTKIVKKAAAESLSLISVDFSQYDASISPYLIDSAFRYIKSIFQPIYHDTIDLICKRFQTIPLLTPSGVLTGTHGVPSGSTFTNEVDSLVQYLIASSKDYVFDGYFQIQGDDGVYCTSKSNSNKLLDLFESYGLRVNREKTYINNDFCIYLQKLYHKDYETEYGIIGGIYPIYRALNRIIYQERWANFEDFGLLGKDYYSLRTISILENCKYHPLFEEFVKFIYEIDKYSLSYSREGLHKYVSMLNESSGVVGQITNQYGDDVKGIKRFSTYKVIKSLA